MKHIFFFISMLVASSLTMTAQNSAEKYTDALLWKVSGNELQEPSYILGTHHLASINFIDSVVDLRKVMDNVDQIAGELLLDDMTSIQTRIQKAAMMPSGETYKTLLTDEEYNRLDEGLNKITGIGLAQLGMLKPGMLMTLCTIALYNQINPTFDATTHLSIDQYIQDYGTENQKK